MSELEAEFISVMGRIKFVTPEILNQNKSRIFMISQMYALEPLVGSTRRDLGRNSYIIERFRIINTIEECTGLLFLYGVCNVM
jgi:hypothetical protein